MFSKNVIQSCPPKAVAHVNGSNEGLIIEIIARDAVEFRIYLKLAPLYDDPGEE